MAGRYDRPGGPFEPHSGTRYVYSRIGDIAYKRLTRTITVPAGGANLSFWVSHDTEAEWDHFFVEAHTAGQEDWTTLPDANLHTTHGRRAIAVSAGWRRAAPAPRPLPDLNADGTCTPHRTTRPGAWNASSGTSGGWQQWNVDLSDYADGQVEISLTYVSDWSVQGLGVFLDDIEVSTGEGSTDFETDLGGWTITGPAEGSAPNPNNFEHITGAGFPEAAVVATERHPVHGLRLRGDLRCRHPREVMGRAVDYLLPE